jgi:organic hydroperoxide reductase OsmC/OhrA
MPFEVETRSLDDQATAVSAAGPDTVIIDRPVSAGGGGLGLNGGELLYLAVAGCVSNDLFREAQAADIALRRVQVRAWRLHRRSCCLDRDHL